MNNGEKKESAALVALSKVHGFSVASVYRGGLLVAVFVGRDALKLYRESPFAHPLNDTIDSRINTSGPVMENRNRGHLSVHRVDPKDEPIKPHTKRN